MKIYLVRHPQTVRNVNNKLTGWEMSLYSRKGKIQFEKIRDYFKGKKLNVYSSDLPRALKLGRVIADESGADFHVNRLLRERNFEETKPLSHHETGKEFRKRVVNFFEKYGIKNGVIVTHAGTIKEIVRYYAPESKIDLHCSRDVIFKIETVKNANKLSKIKV